MGYLYLALSLAVGTAKGWCGKKSSQYAKTLKTASLANVLRMLLCVSVGCLMMVFDGGLSALRVDLSTFLISALCGAGFAFSVITWLFSVRTGAYMMMDAVSTASCVIPITVCALLYQDETVRWIQIPGFLILMAAVLLLCSYSAKIKQKITVQGVILLVFNFLANGATDLSSKLFVKLHPEGSISAYSTWTYLICGIILLGMYFISLISSRKSERAMEPQVRADAKAAQHRDLFHMLPYSLAMGALLFAHTFLRTKAALFIPASQLYPLSQGLNLVLSTVMVAICFKEKPSVRSLLGVVLIFVGLLFINVL